MQTVIQAIEALYQRAHANIKAKVAEGDRISASKLNQNQLGAHALAYLATELEACRQLSLWAERVGGEYETKVAHAYVGEVARTLVGGVDLGACENISLSEVGITESDLMETLLRPEIIAFSNEHSNGSIYLELAAKARDDGYPDPGMGDAMLDEVRAQFSKFVDVEVIPQAQDIHRNDILIPMETVEQMSELGVFGLTIPEEYGGLGMSKVAMCVVTEELSRGYIGVGSLGTRAEIAAELIMGGGTEEQKQNWLPRIAAGEVLSTAVFTEPNIGSDLAHLGTRAVKQADGSYVVNGAKTWITHAVRADLMTLLARTNPDEPGYRGLSMFLAEKTRLTGEDGEPEFVDEGLTGTEIKVLGYRGMKEYELSFDNFKLPPESLLGGEEGAGFKQLMRTFESARIQTAARGGRCRPVRAGRRHPVCNGARAVRRPDLSVPSGRSKDRDAWSRESKPLDSSPTSAPERRIRRSAATSKPAWPSSWRPERRGNRPTPTSRSTAATATQRNTPRPGS